MKRFTYTAAIIIFLQTFLSAHPGHLSYEYSPIHYYLSPDHGLIFTLLIVAGVLILYDLRHQLAKHL